MKNKNNVFNDFYSMIEKSWTWERLSTYERQRFYDSINKDDIKGTYEQRWLTLNSCYHSYLIGLGYEPIGWRETKEVPQF